MRRKGRHGRCRREEYDVNVAVRDFACDRFLATVTVHHRTAFTFTYRLHAGMLHYRSVRVTPKDMDAFLRLFGWGDFAHAEAALLLRLFLQREQHVLLERCTPFHVAAAARAGRFERIPNGLAADNAHLILPYVRGAMKRRLLAFESLEEAAQMVSHHWSRHSRRRLPRLPELAV